MTEDWEDWDCDNNIIPLLHVRNKEQIKRLEERKLIEESEIALMKDLFDNNSNTNNNNKETTEIKKNKPKISKQQENELKQKEMSIKLKLKKEQEKKQAELYGECRPDKYDDYDDKLS
jgi:hypothetical protein